MFEICIFEYIIFIINIMNIYFIPRGRLGNALFRYLACALFCIIYNSNYCVNGNKYEYITDNYFNDWIKQILNNKIPDIENKSYSFYDFYQHDEIYNKYKDKLLNYMKNNVEHYVLTDGINAGDGQHQTFFIHQIINNPIDFTKFYYNVIHVRLNDFVKIEWHISVDKYYQVLNKLDFTKKTCIVCQKPESEFEINYINTLLNKYNCVLECNDTLTDFHIMRNAKIMVCSNSTLSWMAVYFSKTIKKCFMPNHQYDFKYPIDNTEIFNI